MPHQKHPVHFIAILIITSQLASSATTKQNASPVYEVINEQARIDDKPKVPSNQGILPYGNPLAGNSIQNARIHASNQQAMFNAERIRQHKAQLQRWMKGPQIIDSYMKAYHDLQENHQLELEEQQATIKDSPVTPTTRGRPLRQRGQNKRVQSNTENSGHTVQNEPSTTLNRVQNKRKDIPRRGSTIHRSEPMKITKADAVVKNIRSRNHRSYGSADYHQYLEPKRYKTVFVSGPSYSQGVNIKPHGDIGLNSLQNKEASQLYTQAIPSESTPTHPKEYGIQKFSSVQEIEALNSLLTKNPTEQLSELNALVDSERSKDEITKETPIDFYFYLKNPALTAPQSVDPTKYASAYMPSAIKDFTPITEEVDDTQDPTKSKGPITFSQPTPSTTATKLETVNTQSNNYYKVEVSSQVISDDTTASQVNHLKEDKETYPSLNYAYQPYYKETGDDTSEMYLHHNAQPTGVQHLAEDGTETSAFGDDNVSILASKTSNKVRSKRSELETDPFLLPNVKTSTESMPTNSTDAPTSEALKRRNPFNKKRGSDFNVFLAPDFQIGEATDYSDYDYEPVKLKKPSKKYEASYEDDYDNYDDFSSPDYDFGSSNLNSYQTYAPSAGYQLESKGFSTKFNQYRRVPHLSSLSQIHSSPPATTYGVPFYGSPHIFSTPQSYLPPKIEFPTVSTLGSFHNVVEPVYMLTQTQLKELIGHHNLNIEHLDVYQLAKENKAKKAFFRPRKYRKRNPFRHVKNNLVKLHKFNF